MGREDIEKLLHSFELFHDCEITIESVRYKTYQQNRIISDYDNGQNCVVFVVGGAIEVYSVALDGREIVLSVLKKGDCFGISNLFLADQELRTVLKCAKASEVILIPKQKLLAMMQKDGLLSMRLAALYNRKVQFLLQKIEFLTMQSGKSKVVEFLLSQADENGIVKLTRSKEHMACMLGISRASLFRELSYLQGQDLICQQPNRIHICDKQRLEELLYQCST